MKLRFRSQTIRRIALLGMLAASLGSITSAQAQSPTIDLSKPPAELVTTPMPLQVVEAYPNLRIERPIVITGAGDGSGRLFIASQYGQIYSIDQKDTDVEEPKLFIDLSDRVMYKDRENEEGFLGLTFHPQFKENGQFFVYYTTNDRPHVSVLSRFTATGDGKVKGDTGSEVELMSIQQPFWNHNGGTIEFGPD